MSSAPLRPADRAVESSAMSVRTKIVATVGPASTDRAVLEAMARAGVDVFRINLSHGRQDGWQRALETIRAIEADLREPLAVMADLCGPKIRVGPVAGGAVELIASRRVAIERDLPEGSAERIATTLGELVDHVRVGQTILLDGGAIRLRAVEADPPRRVVCEVVQGGVLLTGRGVHLPETELRLPALTGKDRRDAAWIAQRDVDLVALSFVQRAEDVAELRGLLPADVQIVAKIEKPQALERIDAIVAAADAIMVARGDLGVEMALAQVPLAQKRLVHLARASGVGCIVATEMLESMTHRRSPTRAEVADVANAVLDGTDAVMLSGETAIGQYPVRAVAAMNEIASAAEDYQAEDDAPLATVRPDDAAPLDPAQRPAAALAAAVRALVDAEDIAAAAVFTVTGASARMLAKQRLPVPILAMCPSRRIGRQMNLLFGLRPVVEAAPEHTRDVLARAETHLRAMGLVGPGQKIVVLSGRPIGESGTVNTLVVHEVQ